MTKVLNLGGCELNYENAVGYMDYDLKEELHNELVPCSEQEFLTAYELKHELKFGEKWFLSEDNPDW